MLPISQEQQQSYLNVLLQPLLQQVGLGGAEGDEGKPHSTRHSHA